MPTKQETFDTVVAHLRRQGEKAMQGTRCCYKTTAGLKCAAGCLIPDEEYSTGIEGEAIDDFLNNKPTQIIKRLGHDCDLVRKLQRIHDYSPVWKWEELFKDIAQIENLVYTEPK